MLNYGFADILDDARQFIGTDMRMCVNHNVGVTTVGVKNAQNFRNVATFF